MPRWRLPLYLLLLLPLSGCAFRAQNGESGTPLPTVRMALVKIPLHRSETDLLRDSDPVERFKPEPVAVAHVPTW